MIVGRVNARRRAMVTVGIRATDGSVRDVDALVDTGFSASLTLAPDVIQRLGLVPVGKTQMTVADRRAVEFDVYQATVDRDGVDRVIDAQCVDGVSLLGTKLLFGHELTIHFADNGNVRIRRVP